MTVLTDGPRTAVLRNRMRVVSERLSHVETVFLGVWLNRGSRSEAPRENGMFHFIEHMLFKGTAARSARRIAEEIEGVGGVLDAYTGKEETSYSARVRAKHLPLALEILADMLCAPKFDPAELDRERQVILEEMKMEEDNPEDLAYERGVQAFWRDHPLGAPILGVPKNIRRFDRAETAAFHRRFYTPENMLVVAVGNVDHDDLCRRLEALFPNREPEGGEEPAWTAPKPAPSQRYLVNDALEQVNFCVNFAGVSVGDPRRDAMMALASLLGGGMSSRLFQSVREERGLAYSVGAFANAFSDSGMVTVYGGCSPDRFDEVMEVSLDEIAALASRGATAQELGRAKEQLIGSLAISLEGVYSRASATARQMLYFDRPLDAAESIRELESVSLDEVNALAGELFDNRAMGVFAVGDLKAEAPARPWRLG